MLSLNIDLAIGLAGDLLSGLVNTGNNLLGFVGNLLNGLLGSLGGISIGF